MNCLFALHTPEEERLNQIMRLMKKKGPPRIWAYWRTHAGRRGWYAMEGSHRIAAASRLALTPIIVPVKLEQDLKHDIHLLRETDLWGVDHILSHFDGLYKLDKGWIWPEYRFRNLPGPRGGLR